MRTKTDIKAIVLEDIENWLVCQLAAVLNQNVKRIDRDKPLYTYGIDSLHMQTLFAEIQKVFLIKIDEHLILDEENIRETAAIIQAYMDEQNVNPSLEIFSEPHKEKRQITFNDKESYTDFTQYPPYQEFKKLQNALDNVFFDQQEGTSTDTCIINGNEVLNFTSYNYLGLSANSKVIGTATEVMNKYGTSVSASRLVSGEKVLHAELESEIASLIGAEDAIVFTTGHATNVNTIAHLYGPEDLILHDELAHNSLILGALYSGATRIAFQHNDWKSVDKILQSDRQFYKRVLIVIEGIYSMDGDIPDLPKFINIKKKHGAWLMVDEAHSIGVLGKHGGGIREHFNVDAHAVDIWMGTLSKAFASCGGYVAGKKELIEYLKYTCPGFVYSVGMPPAMAGAALAAIRLLKEEPERVARLKNLSALARETALSYHFDIGFNDYTPILPIIIGDSKQCISISKQCFQQGINIKPIIYPAVPENLARLRIFISAEHKETQIEKALTILFKIVKAIKN
ncbi:aminotransferase class I/II-fold pyridoxal phosphate-dependent enzyme [Legionella hackeliae]|uniref:8-amino-7-oxononanoate synthase n=1 Tax=Legionella hackeliae TaxID=449 RepID=A0A0A8UYJ8_LEGHA|nr:aminotransferase class I/II-fold pyridoxal phosphate-dependent enzyme [Legionella hackeliae]KTD12764.1 aminotransferase [Legionella hackeliae]CEK12187.1 8-amino-7-oxononanoate synthase [Legionella hackeliae]STX48973.1 aminotransferase [Legionella hackeliae]